MNTTDLTRTNSASGGATASSDGSGQINVGTTERILSTVGGAALTVLALRNLRSPMGFSRLLSGGLLLIRGLTGYCPVNQALGRNTNITKDGGPVEVDVRVNVARPRHEVYSFWRRLENLPTFMKHLEKVEELTETRSRWTAKGPGGIGRVSWDAEILEDEHGERISWRSLPGSTVENSGEVRFADASGNETEIEVRITYRLPAGAAGTVAARLFSPVAGRLMKEDIQSLRKKLEGRRGETSARKTSKRQNSATNY